MNNMNVLEKILEEIKERIEKLNMADNMCRENAERNRNFEGVKYFQSLMFATERAKSIIEDIIRSHMDEVNDTNVPSKRLIDEQPTVCTGDGWIPYTEQSKPKKDGIYLVTCDDEEYPVKRMRFKECLWYWTCGIYDGKILAWQPLPEPYKVEEMKTDIFNANNKNYPIYEYRGCWLPEEIEKMNLIEQALSIKLFTWQKSYIKNGNFRCFGKTTAVIIRILTQRKEPVDLRNREKIQKYVMMDTPWIATGPVCGVFKREVKEIHEKLLAAGVKTNPVFYTEMDRKKFLRKEEKDE